MLKKRIKIHPEYKDSTCQICINVSIGLDQKSTTILVKWDMHSCFDITLSLVVLLSRFFAIDMTSFITPVVIWQPKIRAFNYIISSAIFSFPLQVYATIKTVTLAFHHNLDVNSYILQKKLNSIVCSPSLYMQQWYKNSLFDTIFLRIKHFWIINVQRTIRKTSCNA